MSDKGLSLVPFVFVIILVSLGVVGWTVYNTYFGSEYQKVISAQSRLDRTRNELENIKNFAGQSLIYSSHLSLQEHGTMGGIVGSGSNPKAWICNSPLVPGVDRVRRCLENYTKYHLNVYLEKYNLTHLPISLTQKNFSSTSYGIDPSRVTSPSQSYDEGNFNVIAKGAKASLYSDKITMSEEIAEKKLVNKTRFWYLYRVFKAWAENNHYGRCIAQCTAQCRKCSCAQTCAQEALRKLNQSFDEHVECSVSKKCCLDCDDVSCNDISCSPTGPSTWQQSGVSNPCMGNCRVSCEDPATHFNPSSSSSTNVKKLQSTGLSTVPSQVGGYNSPTDSDDCGTCTVYRINKLASLHIFSCSDEKYYVPGDGSPNPLVFSVQASGSFKAHSCPVEWDCNNETTGTGWECECPDPCPDNDCN